jgi:chromosome segregation ATPase
VAQERKPRARTERCPHCGDLFTTQGFAGHLRGAHGDLSARNGIQVINRAYVGEPAAPQNSELERTLAELRNELRRVSKENQLIRAVIEEEGKAARQSNEPSDPVERVASLRARLRSMSAELEKVREEHKEAHESGRRHTGGIFTSREEDEQILADREKAKKLKPYVESLAERVKETEEELQEALADCAKSPRTLERERQRREQGAKKPRDFFDKLWDYDAEEGDE